MEPFSSSISRSADNHDCLSLPLLTPNTHTLNDSSSHAQRPSTSIQPQVTWIREARSEVQIVAAKEEEEEGRGQRERERQTFRFLACVRVLLFS